MPPTPPYGDTPTHGHLILEPLKCRLRNRSVGWVTAMLLLGPWGGAAAAQGPVEYRLDNGLTVLVLEDHRAGVAVSMLWVAVGSGQEHRPVTGISHILEHMMFKGTETRETGEFSRIVAREGGRMNAFVSRDATAYFQQVAVDRLEIMMELEAERMHRLVFDEGEFEREMEVVREERRQRVDDRPESLAMERFNAVTHLASPYRHPVIGWPEDLDRIDLDDVKAWYRRWYAPANATLIVVGAVDPQEVRAMAERHFGAVPAGEAPPQPAGREIGDPGERRVHVALERARLPLLYIGYNVPSLATADDPADAYALLLAAQILDGGRSARLPERLIRERGVATSASASYGAVARLDSVFSLTARPADGEDADSLEAALRAEIEALRDEPVDEEELQRAVTRLLADRVYGEDSLMGRAMRLGRLVTTGIGWEEGERFEARIRAVTPEDIQRVAQRYLRSERMTVGWLEPAEEQS